MSSSNTFHHMFWSSLSLNMELTNLLVWMQKASQCWVYRHRLPCLGLTWVLGVLKQFLALVQQAFYPLDYLLSQKIIFSQKFMSYTSISVSYSIFINYYNINLEFIIKKLVFSCVKCEYMKTKYTD